jgi:hypothetical protein
MFGDLYSMEADNDEIDVCMKSQVNDETAVTEAGTDTEATDVSNIDTKTEAHNELASTGGVATGSDTADMEMDPVAATEAFCFKAFSMSAEDLANEVEDNIKVANAIPDADDAETAADTSDPELEAVGMNNAGVSTDDPAKVIPDETPADNAGITPDADESKDDGEDDADAPTNPIPPALPTSEENLEFSEEDFEQSLEKAGGYFKAKDFKIPKAERAKGQINKKTFESGASFMNSKLGQSKINDLKAEFKKRGLTFATREDCKTQKTSLANKLIRAVYPSGNDHQIINEQFYRDMTFIEKDSIIFSVVKYRKIATKSARRDGLDQGFSICALGKNKKGTIDAVLYAKIPSRTYAYIENIDSKEALSRESVPYTDFI